jgi:hypothetical protein
VLVGSISPFPTFMVSIIPGFLKYNSAFSMAASLPLLMISRVKSCFSRIIVSTMFFSSGRDSLPV